MNIPGSRYHIVGGNSWQTLVDLKKAKLNKLVFRWESTRKSQDYGLDWKLKNHLEEDNGNFSCFLAKKQMGI